jgi:GTPase SAR1 family protein
VYDITNRRSFKELNYWIQTVKQLLNKEEVIIGIAANKYDLIEYQEVSKEEGEQFAKENNCLFYETSAKDHYSIKRVFEGLVRAYLEKKKKQI